MLQQKAIKTGQLGTVREAKGGGGAPPTARNVLWLGPAYFREMGVGERGGVGIIKMVNQYSQHFWFTFKRQ